MQITANRRKHALARLKDRFWRENYAAGLACLSASSFCRGTNDRGWKASFDWFVHPDTLPKILEGKYDDKAKPLRHPVTGQPLKGNHAAE